MIRVCQRPAVLLSVVLTLLAGACGDDGNKPEASPQSGSEAPKGDGDTIKIGGMWAMTGVVQSFGRNSSAVFKMAIEEINAAGGVDLADGRKVQLEPVIYDEGCPTPETGIAAARKAAADPVLVIIGPTCSSTAEPVFGLLQKTLDDAGDSGLQVPFFTDTAIKAGLAKLSPWAFRNVPSEIDMYATLFKRLSETTDFKTLAVGTEVDFAHSKSTSENAIKAGAQQAGFTIVADEGWKLADTDFSTQAAKIRQAKPDVVAVASHPFTTCGFLKELGRQAFRPQAIVALTSSITDETLDGCGEEAEGIFGPTSFAPISDRAAALSKKAAVKYHGFVDLHSAPVYENLMLLKDIFKPAGVVGKPDTVQADRRRIRDELEKVTEFDGLLGKIKFRHDLGGEVEKSWLIVEVKNGGFVVQWIPPQFEEAIKQAS
jgi:branched-chain amino acid transport system substrate-binding protein